MHSESKACRLQAIGAGSKAIADTCNALQKLQQAVGKPKRQAIPPVGQELRSLIEVCAPLSKHLLPKPRCVC